MQCLFALLQHVDHLATTGTKQTVCNLRLFGFVCYILENLGGIPQYITNRAQRAVGIFCGDAVLLKYILCLARAFVGIGDINRKFLDGLVEFGCLQATQTGGMA